MTSEVCVMNRLAVVLAADSATTVTGQKSAKDVMKRESAARYSTYDSDLNRTATATWSAIFGAPKGPSLLHFLHFSFTAEAITVRN
jgi:hypothetical protein